MGVASAAAAMDEGLLQLPEPEVGSGCRRRLEVPAAQAVSAHRAHQSSPARDRRGEGEGEATIADKSFSRMERPRLPKHDEACSCSCGCGCWGQQIRMRRRPKDGADEIDLGAQTNHSH